MQNSIIGVLRRLCWYRKVLYEHSGGCAGAEDYYMSTREAVLVQKSILGELGRLCWYGRVF